MPEQDRINAKFDSEEKINAGDISVNSKIVRKADNFWYHYKWPIIICLFFGIVLIICVLQMCNRENEDIMTVYAGGTYISAEQGEIFSKAVAKVMPSDFDGDGEKIAKLTVFTVYSEDEIKQIESKKDENGQPEKRVNTQLNAEEHSNFHANFRGGQFIICFVSEYIYGELKSANRLAAISDVCGTELPSGTLADGYGVRLGDTDFYKYFEDAKVLPEDTIVCISVPQVLGKSADEKIYRQSVDTFKALVGFKVG